MMGAHLAHGLSRSPAAKFVVLAIPSYAGGLACCYVAYKVAATERWFRRMIKTAPSI